MIIEGGLVILQKNMMLKKRTKSGFNQKTRLTALGQFTFHGLDPKYSI